MSETTGTLVLMTLARDTEDTEVTEKSSNTLNVDGQNGISRCKSAMS